MPEFVSESVIVQIQHNTTWVSEHGGFSTCHTRVNDERLTTRRRSTIDTASGQGDAPGSSECD